MLRPSSTVVVAASLFAATLALSVPTQAKDSEAAPTAAATAISARAQTATPVKRVRKVSTQARRVAWVAPHAPYHPQCFLFWCSAGGRPYNFLVLGVAY